MTSQSTPERSIIRLKSWQEPAYKNLVSQKRHYLLLRMGLGKTYIATKAMYDVNARVVLIICPSNAFLTWESHIDLIYNGLDEEYGKDTSYNIHRARSKYNNREKRRARMAFRDSSADLNVYMMTGAAFLKDADVLERHHFDTVIIDETARVGLKSHQSKLFKALKPFVKACTYFWPMTGTPGHTPKDFWPILHLIDHRRWSSFHQFMHGICYWQINPWGGKEYLGIKNREAWNLILNAKTTILSKQEVGHTPTIRSVLDVEMDEDQSRLYKEYMEESYAVLPSGDIDIVQLPILQVLKFRQLLICPKILDPSLSIGAAFTDLVETLKETDPHVVIYTPFTKAIPHFKEYLRQNGFSDVFILSGEEHLSPESLAERIDAYRRTKGIIICSILYATSFSLEPAKECFFVGYEWDPDDNEQAEERLNRLTTKHLVNSYYYCYSGTYDETQLTSVNVKRMNANTTLNLVPQKTDQKETK